MSWIGQAQENAGHYTSQMKTSEKWMYAMVALAVLTAVIGIVVGSPLMLVASSGLFIVTAFCSVVANDWGRRAAKSHAIANGN